MKLVTGAIAFLVTLGYAEAAAVDAESKHHYKHHHHGHRLAQTSAEEEKSAFATLEANFIVKPEVLSAGQKPSANNCCNPIKRDSEA